MKAYVLYDPAAGELAMLSAGLDFQLRRRGSTQIPESTRRLERLKAYVQSDGELKLLVCDVNTPGVLPVVEQIREKNRNMKLVLVADETISPVSYIRPGILPTALLWRPLEEDGIRQTLGEVISSIPMDGGGQQEDGGFFSLELRGAVKRYAYQDIFFFEARDKKLLLHLQRREIPFPGTLEKLMQELPQDFIRVHKSFIVNKRRITEIRYGQNLMILEGSFSIPISRTYKASVKAVFE